MNQTVGSDRTI